MRKECLKKASHPAFLRVSWGEPQSVWRKFSGFTLAELVVVITILAILATIGFLALSGYTKDAMDAKMKANIRSVQSAIASESAITGNSPRWYVSHDSDYALSWAYLYVDGNPVALTGGNIWTPPTDSNYSAGTPRWDRLKLDGNKFKIAASGLFPTTFAAFDKTALSVGAVGITTVSSAGKTRTANFFQVAGILPDTGTVALSGDFPTPSASDIATGQSNGKPAVWGLVRNPDSGPTQALTQSSSISKPTESQPSLPIALVGTASWTASTEGMITGKHPSTMDGDVVFTSVWGNNVAHFMPYDTSLTELHDFDNQPGHAVYRNVHSSVTTYRVVASKIPNGTYAWHALTFRNAQVVSHDSDRYLSARQVSIPASVKKRMVYLSLSDGSVTHNGQALTPIINSSTQRFASYVVDIPSGTSSTFILNGVPTANYGSFSLSVLEEK